MHGAKNIVFLLVCCPNIFGPKRDELTREWRKLQNKELNELYSSPNIARVIKSKIMRWAGHVARMGGEDKRIQGFGGET